MPDAGWPIPDAGTSGVWLSNNRLNCGGATYLGPAPTQSGHLVAALLRPARYPYQATRVRYQLSTLGARCQATAAAHRVEVFKGSTLAGSSLVATLPQASAAANVWQELTLPSPVSLAAGELLFVAVSLPVDGAGSRVCLKSCTVVASPNTYNYWSEAAAPPYAWKTFEAKNQFGSVWVEAQ